MAGGLAALLDDVATIAKLAASSVDDVGAAAGRASAKAVGVVVDDTAVTPRYVRGLSPKRELPIIWTITKGSLRNKLVFILPAAMLLSQFAPWALTPLLMLGGTYLAFEGAEKLWEYFTGTTHETPAVAAGPTQEKTLTSGAIRTDFILSAEIMVISLNEVAAEPFFTRLGALIAVALVITALVYGVVAVIVKMDDIGLALSTRDAAISRRVGRFLLAAMPRVMTVLAVVGTIAMLWVGGHILLTGADSLGWHGPYGLVHRAEEWVAGATGAAGGVLGWFTGTLGSAVTGFLVGAVVAAILSAVRRVRTRP